MTTVLQIVNGAAVKIGLKTAEVDLEAFEFQQILDEMNDMLSIWADRGLTPAFVQVSNSTDTVNIEDSAVSAAKNNLAINIAPSFDKLITPALAKIAADTLQALQSSTVFLGRIKYPDTLPMGSGNGCTDYEERFFPANLEKNF
jgi:hypothetical protein